MSSPHLARSGAVADPSQFLAVLELYPVVPPVAAGVGKAHGRVGVKEPTAVHLTLAGPLVPADHEVPLLWGGGGESLRMGRVDGSLRDSAVVLDVTRPNETIVLSCTRDVKNGDHRCDQNGSVKRRSKTFTREVQGINAKNQQVYSFNL